MEIGIMVRYGKAVAGREEQAIQLFDDSQKYFKEKHSERVLTYFEPFFYITSDREEETGFFVLKGPAPEIFKLMEEEKYLWLVQKAMLLLEHFQVDLLTVGEGIPAQLERSAKVRVELGV